MGLILVSSRTSFIHIPSTHACLCVVRLGTCVPRPGSRVARCFLKGASEPRALRHAVCACASPAQGVRGRQEGHSVVIYQGCVRGARVRGRSEQRGREWGEPGEPFSLREEPRGAAEEQEQQQERRQQQQAQGAGYVEFVHRGDQGIADRQGGGADCPGPVGVCLHVCSDALCAGVAGGARRVAQWGGGYVGVCAGGRSGDDAPGDGEAGVCQADGSEREHPAVPGQEDTGGV